MVIRTHCNSNPTQNLEPKLIFPGLAYSRSTTVLPSITQTFCCFSCLFPIKRKCPLRSSRIENSWHMMKNQNSWYFVQRYPWSPIFSWNIFLNATKNNNNSSKKVRAPRGVKNAENWRDTCPQVNFVPFNSHQWKPCFELRNGLVNCFFTIKSQCTWAQ